MNWWSQIYAISAVVTNIRTGFGPEGGFYRLATTERSHRHRRSHGNSCSLRILGKSLYFVPLIESFLLCLSTTIVILFLYIISLTTWAIRRLKTAIARLKTSSTYTIECSCISDRFSVHDRTWLGRFTWEIFHILSITGIFWSLERVVLHPPPEYSNQANWLPKYRLQWSSLIVVFPWKTCKPSIKR